MVEFLLIFGSLCFLIFTGALVYLLVGSLIIKHSEKPNTDI